uniref:Transporter n=1 Tax=Brugia timori TaxID=42155 RepID=A0A0R3QBD4_9BILA
LALSMGFFLTHLPMKSIKISLNIFFGNSGGASLTI